MPSDRRFPMLFSRVFLVIAVSSAATAAAYAQRPADTDREQPRSADPIENISNNVTKLSRTVEGLTKNWKEFFAAFSTNQGLQLTERQQRILLALEVLNRAEVRLGNLQKMRMDASEKSSNFRLALARIDNELLPENIDRNIVFKGTMDAEELRERRRQFLQKERIEMSNLINQVQRELDITNEEIRQTDFLLKNLRSRLYPEIEKELADL